MRIRKALLALAQAIADEAKRMWPVVRKSAKAVAEIPPCSILELARNGEAALRQRLRALTLEQLPDVVAQYGMDPGKLVMKWIDSDRVINRIVEVAFACATKGDAFRGD